MGQLQWWGTRYGGVGVALSFPPDACSGQAAKLLFPWEGLVSAAEGPRKSLTVCHVAGPLRSERVPSLGPQLPHASNEQSRP